MRHTNLRTWLIAPLVAAAVLAASVIMGGTPSTADALTFNQASGRSEVVTNDVAQTALLVGDSQSAGAAGVPSTSTWPVQALNRLGYHVKFCGRGGTGYVASFSNTGNYPDALEHGDWHIPYGKVPLVVIEGGGNDATHGATDTAIIANATRLVKDLKASYPDAKFIMVGTLARGANYGGGRRTEVDTLLRHFADDQGIAFISAGDWITRYGLGTHMADSVHLKPAGHKILTDVLAAQLTSVGAPHAKPADPAS